MRRLACLALIALPAGTQAAAAMSPAWFEMQMADYPAEALAARQEGDVPITIRLRADGTVESCHVDSGPKLLRRASCAVVAQRGLFAPAEDGNGVAVAQVVKAIARWSIPKMPAVSDFGGATPISPTFWIRSDDYPEAALKANEAGVVEVAFDINENGRVTSCTVVRSSHSSVLDRTTCRLITARAAFLAAVDGSGAPRATKGRTRFTWALNRMP